MKRVKPLMYGFVISILLFSILCLGNIEIQTVVPRVAAAAEANISLQPFLTGLAQPLFVTNAGASWQDIHSGLPADANTCDWRVPNIQTKKARVRVISFGSVTTGQDESDTNFKIKARLE